MWYIKLAEFDGFCFLDYKTVRRKMARNFKVEIIHFFCLTTKTYTFISIYYVNPHFISVLPYKNKYSIHIIAIFFHFLFDSPDQPWGATKITMGPVIIKVQAMSNFRLKTYHILLIWKNKYKNQNLIIINDDWSLYT